MAHDLTWYGCELSSGAVIEELPHITSQGTISKILATATSATLQLPIPSSGPATPPKEWRQATQEGRTMIVAELGGRLIWAGIVLVAEETNDPVVTLACVTPEGYLDRRYVGDHNWQQQDQASVIAAGLLADANVEGIGLVIDAPTTGVLRDRQYFDADDKTVYSALRELMGVQGGPEWTIQIGWADADKEAVQLVAVVRNRIGFASAEPLAVFDSKARDSSIRFKFVRDYTAGKGGNHIVATSSGQGEDRPQSSPARAEDEIAGGWPRWEHRFTPSTSITDTSTLDAHALAELALQRRGSRTITMSAAADASPRLGLDWLEGDDVGYNLAGPAQPAGVSGVGRAAGWRLNPRSGIVEPILVLPGEELSE